MGDAPALLILVGAVVAGFVQGLSGFAIGLVATAFWSYALPPQVIAPLITLCAIFGQLLSIRAVLPSLNLRLALPMLLGGMAGVPIGVALLPRVDAVLFQCGVGLLLVVYCPAMILIRNARPVGGGGRWADAAVGLVGGVMGGIAGLGGPAPTIWCQLRGWDRHVQRAVFQSFLIVSQAAVLLAYLASGTLSAEVLRLSAWVLPCTLLPALLGSKLYARISAEAFRRVVLALLFLSGLALLAQSLPVLARGLATATPAGAR